MIDQFGIAFAGVTAVALSQSKSIKAQKYACLFGLAGQPFWFYATYHAEQWGIFVLCVFYALAWANGFKNYWLR